jgi:NADH:ubiquinone oxidoreductase subunit E
MKMCTGVMCLIIGYESGFSNVVKKLHLLQPGDKSFRYFRMTQICQDVSHHQIRSY